MSIQTTAVFAYDQDGSILGIVTGIGYSYL
jgi:hypothetical protein